MPLTPRPCLSWRNRIAGFPWQAGQSGQHTVQWLPPRSQQHTSKTRPRRLLFAHRTHHQATRCCGRLSKQMGNENGFRNKEPPWARCLSMGLVIFRYPAGQGWLAVGPYHQAGCGGLGRQFRRSEPGDCLTCLQQL